MSDLPYSTAVLRHAADISTAGRLPHPSCSHTAKNPICGDRTTIDLSLADHAVTAVAHDTKACVLTQAAASILAKALPGHGIADLAALKDAIEIMLEGGAAPEGDFAPFAVLADVARHPARHRCVLLPIEAALTAVSEPVSENAEPST
ncbi:NifU-like protein involved in Fe-S cluster formation [Rhizomicrobium palustre]|uniref:NifU-like protein involved in Fe-S cluster formation n=1 Tax=Rhizomicrobium palustre TaxID=189966 RepID=A0A846N2G2_9PROT|nr:iron-sulfur cluster assembly scaffold protein [Rhizomicrobium palustre]NIK89926.1 NifU-like protein involved in Fe-S cluster formation [Rhizomicrobium palustre]